ncbi:hypothetical protein B4Q04_17315 [Zobellia sp. OII3]|uniref:sugar-transfer associated ATP-grasp domain-containing protein n=1 Tax=Zobellia sp. OII3 TaxID=2034520 RepID=UPI000B52C2CD|nr:sugar-transfer associated ATP-grasp domain-containing protein [Zobellia sp. OII3]OWW24232.1 hypothetical protein B4Q04_17315 [Zobellia sp. OII3]
MSAILDVIVKAYHLIQFFLFKLWVIIEIFKFGYLNVYLSEEYKIILMMNPLSIFIYGALKAYEVLSRISHDMKWQIKIKNLLKSGRCPKLSKEQVADIKKFYSEKKVQGIKTYWHRFYFGCNGIYSAEYIPENLFYIYMEPKLNNRETASVLMDKNMLEKLIPGFKQPKTVIKNINGFFFNNKGEIITRNTVLEILKRYAAVVIKPSLDTGGGKNVSILTNKDMGKDNLNQLLDVYGKNFIVQQKLKQHELMANLNFSSLNTFRVMTYLRNSEVVILSAIVRMGRNGAVTDNSTTGGVSCGVKPDGTLNAIGYQLSGDKFFATSTGTKFDQIHLPFFEEIRSSVEQFHREMPYFKIISWDLAIDKKGDVVLIEVNLKGQDITFHQLNNGPVLKLLLDEL